MTFEEAKKILKKEGYDVGKVGRPSSPGIVFTAYGSPEICEAMQVVCSAGYGISMVSVRFDDRKARLSLELAENSAPVPGPGEEQPEKGNPALEEAASRFNDALLDDQGKKIKHLTKKIARLNKIIHKKNLKIEEFRKECSRHLRGKIKMFVENPDLSQELCDKNEELRLTKIREKKLADKIVARALKSAESALAYKEKVIAGKDEVIADLGKELAEAKKLNTAKIPDINAKCMRAARESINDVFESYAAKYAKSTLDELKDKAYESFNAKAHKLGLAGSKDGNGIFNNMIRVDIAEEGGDQSATIVQCGNGITLSKDEAEIIERCTKNGTELHYSEKDGFTYTNVFGDEIPVICLRGMYQVFTDEEIKNMKK